MKLLFFDMEFANGQIKGSIYSIGYTVTDESFQTLVPPTDLLLDPDAVWNRYVEENILAYPKEEIEASPKFYERYDEIKALFESVDVAVGFSLDNDMRELRGACLRYELEMPHFQTLDTELLCRKLEEHKEAHGLAGYVRAWCGEEPANQHRSDGDALATMHLLRGICKEKHVTPEMLMLAFPGCCSSSDAGEKRKKKRKKFFRKGKQNRAKKAQNEPKKKKEKPENRTEQA